MDAIFLGRVVARRLVIRAAIVPDDDISLAPLVAILAGRLNHVGSHLLDDRIALLLLESFDTQDLALVKVE